MEFQMPFVRSHSRKLLFNLTILSFAVFAGLPAKCGESVVHAFRGGNDGAVPDSALIADHKGTLYGTTYSGGGAGYGTVFKLAPDGKETILYAFAGGSDGSFPGGLLADKAGDLFGTTFGGGFNASTVFKLSPDDTKTILHTFQGGGDGLGAAGTLIADQNGNLYGTTAAGGNTGGACGTGGCGTVFEVTPDGTETVLYAFGGGSDGFDPSPGAILDGAGNLFETPPLGGTGGRYGP